MELMPGYKHSDVGMIPYDWDTKPLGEIGDSLIGLTYRPSEVRNYGTLVLRSSNVQNGTLCFDDNVFVETDIPERIMVRPGDILVCVRNGSRDLIGKSALIDERAIGMTFGAFMGVFRSEFGQFLHHVFQSGIFKKQINEHLGATINQITNKSLNSFKVPLPPTDEERTAIANALSDVDALIATLDQVITKKRDLKQATMQQLLTGKTRLPGFVGDWDVVEFGDIATIRNEKVLCSSTPEGTPCVELEFIGQTNGRLLGYIETTGSSSKYSFKEGDVLFGRLRAYLRKHWRATFDGVCSTEIWPLIPRNERLYGGYLQLLVQMNSFVDAACVSYGTHMPRSDWTVLEKFEVHLPSVPEQAAISASLSDMDAELETLEKRQEKNRQLKQAMMQELLTGKTRLV
ncbi:restriction endonuclease subunit S [Aeromonas veronii]|uniref:restriction endonuclease subunit S n=1 Tax=Aeromonas veronii TaxID=654 RepID=UPI003D259E59